MVLVGPSRNAGLYSFALQPRPSDMGVVSGICPHLAFVAPDQIVRGRGVVNVGRRRDHSADQTRPFINANVCLVAKCRAALTLALDEARIGIIRRPLVLRWSRDRL